MTVASVCLHECMYGVCCVLSVCIHLCMKNCVQVTNVHTMCLCMHVYVCIVCLCVEFVFL